MGSGACAGGGNPVQIQDPLRVVRKEDSRFPRSYFSFRGKQKDSSIYPAIINYIIIYMNPTLFREILPIPLSKAPKESPWNEK